jgi:DHA1 family arabinose polymer transporter-like MFS transporter
MKPGLIALMLGGLSIGMAEFMPMGLLPDIAATLSVDIPTAGHLISAYALGVVIGAPILAGLTERLSICSAFIGLMGAVSLFNLLFALAPNFELLFVARLFAGLPHGAFFGLGAVAASRLASPGKEAQAVSIMFAGLTIANVAGVPLGTFIGHHFGWRAAFALVALAGIGATWCIARYLPELSLDQDARFIDGLKVLKQSRLWLLIMVSAIGTGGLYAWISYIAPLAVHVGDIPASQISLVMIVAGLSMALGNEFGGRLADRFSPLLTTAGLLFCMSGALVLLALTAHITWVDWTMTFAVGAIAFAVISPLQVLMIDMAPGQDICVISHSIDLKHRKCAWSLSRWQGHSAWWRLYQSGMGWCGAGVCRSYILLAAPDQSTEIDAADDILWGD